MRNIDTESLDVADYSSESFGGGLRWGVPIGEDDYINFGLSYDHTKINDITRNCTTIDPNTSLQYQRYVCEYGNTTDTFLTTFGWQKDERDSVIFPTSGRLRKAIAEVSLPGSTVSYYRASYQHLQFFPLIEVVNLDDLFLGVLLGQRLAGRDEADVVNGGEAGQRNLLGLVVLVQEPVLALHVEAADIVAIITNHSKFDYNMIVDKAQLIFDARNATQDIPKAGVKVIKL